MDEINFPTIISGKIVEGGEFGPEIRVVYEGGEAESCQTSSLLGSRFIEMLLNTKNKIFGDIKSNQLQYFPEVNKFLGRKLLGIAQTCGKGSVSKQAILTENYYWDTKLDGSKKYDFNLHIRKGDEDYPEIRELEAVVVMPYDDRVKTYSLEKLSRKIIFDKNSNYVLSHSLLPEGGLMGVPITGYEEAVDFAKKDIDKKILNFFLE